QSLPAGADDPRRVAHDALGSALGLGRWVAPLAAQLGPGAEALLSRTGEHDHADPRVGRRLDHPVTDLIPHRRRHGVAGIGAVQRDPADAVLQAPDQVIADVFAHLPTARASRAMAPLGRAASGLMSSSASSACRSIAILCTFMITSTR